MLDIKPGFKEGQGIQSTALSMDCVCEKCTEAQLSSWSRKLEQLREYQEFLLSVYYKEKQTVRSINIKCINEKKKKKIVF